MLFNSFQFVFLFFPLVFLLYFSLPPRHRWILLLSASYYFYMCWKVEYVLLIFTITLSDYTLARKMASYAAKSDRKKWLILALGLDLGILLYFKYANFLSTSAFAFFNIIRLPVKAPEFNILLPIGISFFTFQSLGYTIDVYRGDRKPEHHFGYYALYVSYFPQLVAGPIERSTHLQDFKRKGFLIIVVSNQSGIARSFYKDADVNKLNSKINQDLAKHGVQIDAFYHCPHHPDYGEKINCSCRKPLPGLLLQAQRELGIGLSKSFLIGDESRDIEAGLAAGVPSILVLSGHGNENRIKIPQGTPIVEDLPTAVEIISEKTPTSQSKE